MFDSSPVIFNLCVHSSDLGRVLLDGVRLDILGLSQSCDGPVLLLLQVEALTHLPLQVLDLLLFTFVNMLLTLAVRAHFQNFLHQLVVL